VPSLKVDIEVGDGVFDLMDDLQDLMALIPHQNCEEAFDIYERIGERFGHLIKEVEA